MVYDEHLKQFEPKLFQTENRKFNKNTLTKTPKTWFCTLNVVSVPHNLDEILNGAQYALLHFGQNIFFTISGFSFLKRINKRAFSIHLSVAPSFLA